MQVDERTEDTITRAIKTAAAIESAMQHLVLMSAIASEMSLAASTRTVLLRQCEVPQSLVLI